jgi:hypothetical protein
MAERRPLIEGLKTKESPVDPVMEKAFVLTGKPPAHQDPAAPPAPPSVQSAAVVQSRVPISTRMRSDFAAALKRASLERQLASIEPNTLQDILEQAVEPWLRSNGYLK